MLCETHPPFLLLINAKAFCFCYEESEFPGHPPGPTIHAHMQTQESGEGRGNTHGLTHRRSLMQCEPPSFMPAESSSWPVSVSSVRSYWKVFDRRSREQT
eukprot:3401811-Rhodomonas_salina.3